MSGQQVDRDIFRQMHDLGLSGVRIAQELGITTVSVYRIRKELGLETGAVRMTEERRAKIQSMLDDGASWMEIKKTLGVQHATMQKHFPGTQWTPEQTKEHVTAVLSLGRQIYQANYVQSNKQRKQRA